MHYQWLIGGAAGLLGAMAVGRWLAVRFGYLGDRVVDCPENRRPAGVRLDAGHAALSGMVGAPRLRLEACSRWPERAGCGQECLSQIEEAPESCLVRRILTEWYRGKSCLYCSRPFGEIDWSVRKPALVSSDKVCVEWGQVPVDQLPATLQTALPVCFACHTANTLVRERPDLVTDRSGR